MKFADKLADGQKRQDHFARWKTALAALDDHYAQTGEKFDRKDFCARHDCIDPSMLCHILAGRKGASWERIKKVDAALGKELAKAGIKHELNTENQPARGCA